VKQIVAIIVSFFIALSLSLSISIAAQFDPVVYQAQKALKASGYNPGTHDGLWGKSTERAVKYFQVDNELPVTGKLDEQTKAKLDIVSTARSVKRNQQAQERRLALVIGNSAYKSAPLRNPANDAQDMATTLKELGFDVILKTNANKRTMLEAINQFGKSLRNAAVGLFFYAGHGMQVNRLNYLIPIGAYVTDETDIEIEGVDARRILGRMETAANDVNIIFLDACRDNPFQRSFRSTSRGLVKMDAPKGTFIAYATSPGDVAEDGLERNSPFTKHVLRNITVPDIPIEKMMKKVRRGVLFETNDKQMPWQASSLTGDFYFASPTSDMPPEPQPSTQLADERAKLERERQELERLKLEFERKKLAAERKRFEEEQKKNTIIASIDHKDREIGRDDHYITYASGVVRDTKTGLEWVVGPDKDTTWDEAKQWANSLTVDGGGWQMPTMDELERLYRKSDGLRNMTPLLKTTGWFVWSEETKGSSLAWYFGFYRGDGYWDRRNSSYNVRAFAVRSRKTAKIETQDSVSISTHVSKSKMVDRDGHFIRYTNGIVRHTKTGLEWIIGPDRDMAWEEAKQWVDRLTVAGSGWRMPQIDDLKTLYEKDRGTRNMTPLLKTTGWFVWSEETKGSSLAWYFGFYRGDGYWDRRNSSYNVRAFAVRDRSSAEWQKQKKETSKYASISSEISKSKVIEKDRHFIKYSNGIVRNTNTGLSWLAGPDTGTNWYTAKKWVVSRILAGGGWRMPTLSELKRLYEKGAGGRNRSSIFNSTGWYVWSSKTWRASPTNAYAFHFDYGGSEPADKMEFGSYRSFAVRSRR